MNALLRSQSKYLKVCLHNNHIGGKCNKHTNAHFNSNLALKYRLDGSSYYIGGASNRGVAGSRSKLLKCYNGAIINSSGFDCDAQHNVQHRHFRIYHHLRDQPSSKVEATVQTMKNKQKEKVEEIMKEAAAASNAATAAGSPIGGAHDINQQQLSAANATAVAPKPAVVKKPLKTRIWEEMVHYYHGFRLLFIDINVCRKMLWRVLNGKTLTRRENKLLVRTTSDLFRLIPFSVFIIVPFMELLLPVFIKFFPGMLPSTFQTAKEREDKLKQSLQVRLEMAKFLQKTLDEMAVQHKEHKSTEAKQFAEFFTKIKDPTEYVHNDEIIKFAKRFDDEITLDSLTREQLVALSRVLELNTMGTTMLLRFQLRVKLRMLSADDRVIAKEGVNALDLFELQQACKARGMRAYGLTEERLRSQLQEWIELSQNEKVSPTLLLLSRAMLISDEAPTTEKLKETIRVLPDAVAAQTKAAIGEREGKIDNKTKIEIIKEEERKIKEEREEQREEDKAKAEVLLEGVCSPEMLKAVGQETVPKPAEKEMSETTPSTASLHDIFADTTTDEKKEITSKDVELLSEALKSLSNDTNKLVVEKETIKDLKEEMRDYKEDVEELQEVRNVVKEPVRESRAAKLLFKKVNSMIGQLDKVLEDLEQKHQNMQSMASGNTVDKTVELTPEQLELKRKEDDLVRIDELVNAIKKLKQTSDESRLKQIENVLSKLDSDKDGVISVDEVLKVVEAIGRDNVNLNEKQIEELLTLMDKENVLQEEQRIKKEIAKKEKEAIKQAEAAAAAEELKDTATDLRDNALDLSADTAAKDILSTDQKTDSSLLEATEKQKEKILPKGIEPSNMPPPIPTPPSSTTQTPPKDKMI